MQLELNDKNETSQFALSGDVSECVRHAEAADMRRQHAFLI